MTQTQNTVDDLLRWHRRAVVRGDLTVLLAQLDLDGMMVGGGKVERADEDGECWGEWMIPYPKAVWLIRSACNHYPLPFHPSLLDAAMTRLQHLNIVDADLDTSISADDEFVADEFVRDLITEIMEHPDALYH